MKKHREKKTKMLLQVMQNNTSLDFIYTKIYVKLILVITIISFHQFSYFNYSSKKKTFKTICFYQNKLFK